MRTNYCDLFVFVDFFFFARLICTEKSSKNIPKLINQAEIMFPSLLNFHSTRIIRTYFLLEPKDVASRLGQVENQTRIEHPI